MTRDMNLHSLPWPKDELEALQDTPVEMRITLSYFIEPIHQRVVLHQSITTLRIACDLMCSVRLMHPPEYCRTGEMRQRSEDEG